MEFDPYAPYGQLVESTLRLVTWNVWGRFGDNDERQRTIDLVLGDLMPDVVCLTEAWALRDENQAQHVASVLGHADHRYFGDRPVDSGWASGIAVSSRWPVTTHGEHRLTDRAGQSRGLLGYVHIDGPRGGVQVFVAMLDYPLGASEVRQDQVRQLLDVVAEAVDHRAVTVVCGDFNAPPDSDEIRLLTGRSASPNGLVFYDAWEVAGDGGPGTTFAQDNPLAAPSLFPDRRMDYILSGWPRRGGCGHPVRAEVVGRTQPAQVPASDHYGVLADLRY